MPSSPTTEGGPLVHLVGYLNSGVGLGESGRQIHALLTHAGIAHECLAMAFPDIARVGGFPELDGPVSTSAPISILSMNGDQVEKFARNAGSAYFQGRRIIGVWYWETDDMLQSALQGARYLDAIWTFSPYLGEVVRRNVPGMTVVDLPHPVAEPASPAPIPADHRFSWPGRHVFQFAFDYQSCARRKNPEGVAEAFIRAFPEPGNAVCVIKSHNSKKHPLEALYLRRRFQHRPDIEFLDDFLAPDDYAVLTARADTYVSLHRSEGLGLTLMEAMARGIPCIATAFSGNLAFMTETNSWLIPWKKAPVGPGSVHYPARSQWAEPDLDAAAAAMREIVADPGAAKQRAMLGRDEILRNHSATVVAERIRDALHQALEYPVTEKRKIPEHGSWSKDASQSFTTIRENEQQLAERISALTSGWPERKTKACHAAGLRLAKTQRSTMRSLLKTIQDRDSRQKEHIQYLERRLETLEFQIRRLIELQGDIS